MLGAGLTEPRKPLIELAQLLGKAGNQGMAGGVLGGNMTGQLLNLATDRVEPLAEVAGRFLTGTVQCGTALLDRRQYGGGLCLKSGPGGIDRFGGARHGAIHCRRHAGRSFAHAGGGGGAAAFNLRDMGGHALGGATQHFIGLAATRGDRRQLRLERAGMAVGGEACILHRLGDGACLLFRSRQIVEEDANVESRGRRGAFQRRCLAIEAATLLGEIVSDASQPVGRLVAQGHQPFRLAAQAGMVFLDPVGDDLQHRLQRIGFRPHRRDGAHEAVCLDPRRAAEQQPEEAEQHQRTGEGADPGNDIGKARLGAALPDHPPRRRAPAQAKQDQQGCQQQRPLGPSRLGRS